MKRPEFAILGSTYKPLHMLEIKSISALLLKKYRLSFFLIRKVQFRGEVCSQESVLSKYHIKNEPVVWDKYPWKPKL